MHSIEGGMIATSDVALAAKLRMLRNQGMSSRYQYELVGLNARMTDVAAAVGRAQLRRLARYTAARQANATWLGANVRGLVTASAAPGAEHVFHPYVVRDRGRDHLAARLRSTQIDTGVHYPVPLHRSPADLTKDLLPHSEAVAREVLSLPVHPGLRPRDLSRIATVVNEASPPTWSAWPKESPPSLSRTR
ncbi:hypothetical protein GCM10009661_49880 [Catellatospora chokoriensis]|uniref:DegT/DnrJ/EryC1/StrS aminotransferase family protein n=1 Tax=Catellatospora chokoriensis TaxID=310353 RepID=A0A8J3K5Y6_9ACTN|nr:hypothetical protein Cch02nite_80630 [Catellatospora chokoriensis]